MPIGSTFSTGDESLTAAIYFYRDVNSLRELGDFAEAFVKLENIRGRLILSCFRERNTLLEEGYDAEAVLGILSSANHTLLQFHVGSLPWAKISATIGFLSLMVGLTANYDKLGPNLQRMEQDALTLVHQISGLTAVQATRVQSEAIVLANYVLTTQESILTELARETSEIRKRINGNNESTGLNAKVEVQGHS